MMMFFAGGGPCRGVAEPNLLSDVSSASAAGPDPIVLASAKMMIMSRMIFIITWKNRMRFIKLLKNNVTKIHI